MDREWADSVIIEETSEVVIVFDRTGNILFGNRSARESLLSFEVEIIK